MYIAYLEKKKCSQYFFEVVEHPTGKGWVFIMEHVEMRPLNRFQAALGEQLAR